MSTCDDICVMNLLSSSISNPSTYSSGNRNINIMCSKTILAA